jgi:hypothetical protein
MTLPQRFLMTVVALMMVLGSITAETKRTPPTESLNGLRPGSLMIDQLTEKYGKPDMTQAGGLLELYGGPKTSEAYGWFMIQNPNYTVPDLAVETEQGSDRVDLVMAIGFEGLKTEKGITCFQSEDEVIQAYGKPDFAFAVPMNGFVLRELYYPALGLSFDLAPAGPGTTERQVIAIYVTYPEYMQNAIKLRHDYIDQGIGKDITSVYRGGQET